MYDEQLAKMIAMQQECGQAGIGNIGLMTATPTAPTLAEVNRGQIQRLEDQLQKRRELAELLEKHPEVERITSLLAQVGRNC
jgi:hypothetical protein